MWTGSSQGVRRRLRFVLMCDSVVVGCEGVFLAEVFNECFWVAKSELCRDVGGAFLCM